MYSSVSSDYLGLLHNYLGLFGIMGYITLRGEDPKMIVELV